jgi:sugar O-acyltransferase (sialic acid O-acetyltransferase NeuD family)
MLVWIYGASGHGKVILDILQKLNVQVAGFLDDNENIKGFMDHKVIRPGELTGHSYEVVVAIGNNHTRKKVVERNRFNHAPAIDPRAIISVNAGIEEGTVVMAGAVIQSGCSIGRHVIINTGALVDHDCMVGDYAHISPGAVLCGNVTVGDCTWVGAGATITEGVSVGRNVIIGAGSLIREDVPDNVLVVGNPQRLVRRLISDDPGSRTQDPRPKT